MDAPNTPEAGPQPSRRSKRRSRLVCTLCHYKKTKCDIQQDPSAPCSKCVDAGTPEECRIRPSRRTKNGRHSLAAAGTGSTADHPFYPAPALGSLGLNSSQPDSLHPESHAAASSGMTPTLTSYSLPLTHVPALPVPDLATPSCASQAPASGPRETSPHGPSAYSGPSPASSGQGGRTVASYLGDSGYLRIFSGDGVPESSDPPGSAADTRVLYEDLPPPALQESYLETYFRRCYALCPIIDRSPAGDVPSVSQSALVQYGLALLGSHIEPPVRQHAEPVVYYERAKALFYGNREKNPLLAISGIMLFYWWGASPPDVVSIEGVWWWTGVAIRQAQQMGLHREMGPGRSPLAAGESPSLRRRIWWTLFARERLTSICMGRPCMIDPEDCNVAEVTMDDFPVDQRKSGEIFIYWVRLCTIVGRVGKHLLPSLPACLRLPIHGPRTIQFNPHVHQLHLTYLTTVTLLYLSRDSAPLPSAYATAVLASCCVARIFDDFTARGSLRFLHGMSGWSIAIAILALLHACKVGRLAPEASAHINVLRIALKELARMWRSADMFDRGMERIDTDTMATLLSDMRNKAPGSAEAYMAGAAAQAPMSGLSGVEESEDGIDWQGFFPFLTVETSPLAAILLDPTPTFQLADLDWPADFTMQLPGFFGPGDINFSMFAD